MHCDFHRACKYASKHNGSSCGSLLANGKRINISQKELIHDHYPATILSPEGCESSFWLRYASTFHLDIAVMAVDI
jgi:hypothetical protein